MEVQTKFNYYDILEVNPQTPQHEVTSSYEKLKLTYNGDNPAIYTIFSVEEARAMLNLVEEAFAVLGNKVLRVQYDAQIQIESLRGKDSEPAPGPVKEIEPKKTAEKPLYKKNEQIEAEIRSCEVWSGEMLAKVRTYKNWSFEAISDLTKISPYYIKGIEKMDGPSLPAPVFVRGYVAQLCRILGLDEKRVCDSYMKIYKERLEQK